MSSEEEPMTGATDPDPGIDPAPADEAWFDVPDATPMIRRLLRLAIRQYVAALEFAREVDRARPAGRRRYEPTWRLLQGEADAQFEAAEAALAERINNGFDAIAPEGRRIGPIKEGAEFVERAVSLDGVVYVLVYDPDRYEAGQNIIAILGADRVASLDG
jgi:hypothetical protein